MRIKTTDNKGIYLTKNGITFSIQFGPGNYCQNRDGDIKNQFLKKPNTESEDCEVAVIADDGSWLTYKAFPEYGNHENDSNDVVGYIPVELAFKRFMEFTEDPNSIKFIMED